MKVFEADGVEKTAASSPTDTDAVHDNVAGEISAVTAKATPVGADYLLIEDSADSDNKKSITIGDIPAFDEVRLNVYNNSGSAITAGQVVYVSGYNVGQGLPEIDLADGDNAAAMPSVGMADATIANTTAGSIVASGIVEGINTAGLSVNDALYVDTTPGAFTDTRPTVDAIQKIGQVLQVAAGGKVLIVGAGRSNDVPIQPSFTDFTNANHDHSDAANGGTVAAGAVPDGADATAIHDNVASEISAITEKASPVGADILIIEDSADSNNKKRLQITNLPAGGEINDLATDGISGIADDQVAIGSGAGTAAYHTLPTGAVAYTAATNTVAQAASTDLSDTATLVSNDQGNTYSTGAQDLSSATSLTVPTSAGAAPTASGQVAYDSTANQLEYGDNGTNRVVANLDEAQTVTNKDLTSETNKLRYSKSITIETPADGDRLAMFMNERAITVLGVSFASVGGTSVLFNVEFAATIASGTVVHTDTCASSTPEWDVTPSGDATIPTDQITAIEITTVTGSVTQFTVTIYYDED